MDPIYLDGPPPPAAYEQIDFDDDEEEDQLMSDVEESTPVLDPGEELEPDSEGEVEPNGLGQGSATNGKRKGQRKPGVRVPGQSLVPEAVVDEILRDGGDGGSMSKEASFILSVATEEFLRRFAQAGYSVANSHGRNIIEYRDLASCTRMPSFRIMEDVVPMPMTLSRAIELRAAYEKRKLEDDPALTAPAAPLPFPDPAAPLIALPSAANTPAPDTPSTDPSTSTLPHPPIPKPTKVNGRAPRNRTKKPPAPAAATAAAVADAGVHADTASPHAPRERRASIRTRDRSGRFSGGGDGASSHPEPQGWSEGDAQPPPPPPLASAAPVPALAGPASAYIDERARSVASSDTPFGSTGRTIYSQR